MGNSVEIAQKNLKIKFAYDPATSRYISKRIENMMEANPMFTAALLTPAKRWDAHQQVNGVTKCGK